MDVKDTPVTSNAPIIMVVASTLDGPATHTCTKTLAPTDTTPPADVQPRVTLNTGAANAPPPLMEDCKDTLQQMQKTDPFCKCILKWLLNSKAPSHEAETHILEVFSAKMLRTQIRNSWHQSSPNPCISQYLLKLKIGKVTKE